jgi:uncharacterized membrane protein
MKFLAAVLLSLMVIPVYSVRAQLSAAATPVEIVNNLGVATPTTQFGIFESSGLTISPRQFVGPEFVLTEPTLITEIGGFVNNCKQIINGVPLCPSTLPLTVQIRPAAVNGFPDPSTILGEFSLSHEDDPLIVSYESVAPNIILEPGTYFALFAPQLDDVGLLLSSASNPFDYQGEALIPIGTFNPSTGLPANVPPSLDVARIAVRILGIAPVSRLVSIDIRPGSDRNKLDPDSDKKTSVAILSVDGFDALTVKPKTVRFGAIGNEAAPVRIARRDVDGNGKRDLVLRFEIQDTEIECGDTAATLTGLTSDGESILGSGPIKTVRCYTFVDIDFPGAAGTIGATKLNDHGQIVGSYFDVDNIIHGFLMDNGLFATIDPPGSTRTLPAGINNRRQIVGAYRDIVGRFHSFLWDKGVFTTIDVPGASSTDAFDINDRRQIVGSYIDANGTFHGFLLDKGVFSTIDIPGADSTQALGINNRGQIVGGYVDTNGIGHGFLLDHGVFVTIDAPGAVVSTSALDINDDGKIVGLHDGGSIGRSSYVLDDGEFTSFVVPGAVDTAALGINNRGEIAGAYTSLESGRHGFLATFGKKRAKNAKFVGYPSQNPERPIFHLLGLRGELSKRD